MCSALKLLVVPQQRENTLQRAQSTGGDSEWEGALVPGGLLGDTFLCGLLLGLGPQASLTPEVTVACLFQAALRWD